MAGLSCGESGTPSRRQAITFLTKTPHGNLMELVQPAKSLIEADPVFYAHFTAWNQKVGSVRDAKVALPVIGLNLFRQLGADATPLYENSLACIELQRPRELERAWRFSREIKEGTHALSRSVKRYLRRLESNKFKLQHAALSDRKALLSLYALTHLKPGPSAAELISGLFRGKATGIFADLAQIRNLDAKAAAAFIRQRKIPFLTALGAGDQHVKDPDYMLALIDLATYDQLLVNAKKFERLGAQSDPACRAAIAQKLAKASTARAPSLRAGSAVESLAAGPMKAQIEATRQAQVQASQLKGVWLVLMDKSGSMHSTFEPARIIAATLTQFVEDLYVGLFDTQVRMIKCTGMTEEQIRSATIAVPGGGTNIGIGLEHMLFHKVEVDGIIIVSDFEDYGEFWDVYRRYCEKLDVEPSVYCFNVGGGMSESWALKQGGEAVHFKFQDFDQYSLPNLVKTLRPGKFSLIDEIFATQLYSLKEISDEHIDSAAA